MRTRCAFAPDTVERYCMLYLEDDRREIWPSVARVLASMESLDMVLCLYPGAGPEEFKEPFRAPETDEYFELPVAHEGGAKQLCSARVSVDDELLTWLESCTEDFEEWGESLALYRPRNYRLVAAAIPHEGVVFVADEFGSDVAAAGFRLSDESPEWW